MQFDTSMRIRGRQIDLRAEIPDGAASGDFLVPLARELSHHIIQIVQEDAQAQGTPVTCRAACGACCRQLVPITTFEARRLAAVVDAMEEPRRTQVRERFAAAAQAMKAQGIDDAMSGRVPRDAQKVLDYTWRYFQMGIPCPFLEQESCSIYAERPVVCREYVVTSPPEHCANPLGGGVDRVLTPASPHQALTAVDVVAHRSERIALVLALEWAATHPEPPPTVPATDQVRLFFTELARAPLPADGGMGPSQASPPSGA